MQRHPRLYTTDYAPSRGGVARYLENLATYVSDSMDVVALDPSTRWWQAFRRFWLDRRSISRIVVSHVLPIGTAAMAFRWVTGTPYVVIVHGMDVGLAKTRWTKRIVAGMVLRGAAVVVANSMALEREVRDEFGVKETVVAYPPVVERPSVMRVAGPSQTDMLRAIGPIGLLTVARLVPRKGHLRVLDAMAALRRQWPAILFEYVIVGNGPELETISRHVADLDLGDRVTIVRDATDEQLANRYAAADIFVMPVVAGTVDREGFGTVYLEAAIHGVPSIATDMPGVDEAVLDGQTGILVRDGDVAALADAMYRLGTNEEERRRLGEEARRRATEEFSADRQFAKLKEYL